MDKRLYICAAIILFLAIGGLLAYNYLEIVPIKKQIRPSTDYYNNNFYALERWLKESGYSVRYGSYFNQDDLDNITEKIIILPSWRSLWEETGKILPWIKQGGFLVLSIDNKELNDNLIEFLYDTGVIISEYTGRVYGPETNIEYPDFDKNISFLIDNKTNAFIVDDNVSFIRLADIPVGNGGITVTGRPYFIHNDNLKKEINAALTWRLTGERMTENDGVLIIRDQRETVSNRSFFGAIAERGNLVPVIVSAFLLIFIGFWMTIPVFGLVFYDKQKNSRPIKDRFAAEIRFLKKQHALTYYLDVYARENKNEISIKKEETYSYRDLINHYRSIFNGTAKI